MSSAEALYVLHETASGYALFDVVELDEVASLTPELQKALADASAFGRMIKLKAFVAFSSAEMALENINAIAEHAVPDLLRTFLETHLPAVSAKKKKKGAFSLGVVEPDLAKAIADATGASVRSDDVIRELIRGAKQHVASFVPELGSGTLEQSQLGLGHAFSRCKVKFNPARADNMIIQSIGLLDTLDKDINTFSMRVREWYSWHFPELRDLVRENYAFARAARSSGTGRPSSRPSTRTTRRRRSSPGPWPRPTTTATTDPLSRSPSSAPRACPWAWTAPRGTWRTSCTSRAAW